MKLDDSQERAKTSIINTVVSAGAGSGKTRVLAERFSYLVTEKGYKIDQILTLTFTKKATVEMKGRIFTTLKAQSDAGNKNAREAVLGFNKAQIMTLDSYFSYVARLGSRFYGITPSFTTDQQAAEKQVRDMAIPFLLEHRDNTAIKAATEINPSHEEVINQLFVVPAEKCHPSRPLDFAGDIKKQAELVSSQWNSIWKELDASVETISSQMPNGKKPTKSEENLRACIEDYDSSPADIPELLPSEILEGKCEKIRELLSKKLIRWINIKKPTGNFMTEDMGEAYGNICQLTYQLFHILNFVSGMETTKASAQLLEQFQEKVLESKRFSGILTHGDVSQMACDILLQHPEIRRLEKQRFRAIMIDEFQDNNSLQRDILYMLAEKLERNETSVPDPKKGEIYPDKLFFVGDEKQSIYKFRGADVSVFNDLKETIASTGGNNLYMDTNYRSEPELIAGFNTFFGGCAYPPAENEGIPAGNSVFLKKNADGSSAGIPAFEAAYGKVLVNGEKLKTADYSNKRIHIAFTEDGNDNEEQEGNFLKSTETEAYWVAEKIHSLIAQGKYKPSEIAILFRTNTRLSEYEQALLNFGIPYSTETRKGFFTDGPVNDLFSFLSLCAYPRDRIYYSKLLASPFVNLTLEEVSNVLALEEEYPFMEGSEKVLASENSRKRFAMAREIFSRINLSSKYESVTQTLSYLWNETGYKYETMWNKKVAMYKPTYDILFELARQSDLKGDGITAFIDMVKTYQDDATRIDDLDVPFEAKDCVNLMTIHKSKGLEFGAVFLIDANSGARGNGARGESSKMLYFTKEAGISFRTKDDETLYPQVTKASARQNLGGNLFYLKAKEEDARLECAELRRIGYVAFTRAISSLYISGSGSGYNPEKAEEYACDKTDSRSILQQITPVLAQYLAPCEDTEELAASENAPFDFERIPPATRRQILERIESTASESKCRNTRQEKIEAIEKANEKIRAKKAIALEPGEDKYIRPSSLHDNDDETYDAKKGIAYKWNKKAPYQEINELIKKSESLAEKTGDGLPVFSVKDFGTIAHAHLEALINGQSEVFIKESNLSGLREIKEDKEKVMEICRKMTQEFASSPLGKEALDSPWKKAEYQFKSKFNGKIASGSMDLVFRNRDDSQYKYTVVDYKTNQTMEPEFYRQQLECYKDALAKIFLCDPSEIRTVLYYLRFGKEAEIK